MSEAVHGRGNPASNHSDTQKEFVWNLYVEREPSRWPSLHAPTRASGWLGQKGGWLGRCEWRSQTGYRAVRELGLFWLSSSPYLWLRLLQMSFSFHLFFPTVPYAGFTLFWLILSGGTALVSTDVLPSFSVT